MKRRISIGVVVAMTAALLVALAIPASASTHPASAMKVDLMAGKSIDVGDVYVWNDATNLYVEYVLDAGWCMSESHLAVASTLADIPKVKGNPIPGQFTYGKPYDPCASGDTFDIPLAGLSSPLYIAADAKVWEIASLTDQWIFSDGGNTTVTATNVPGLIPPFQAVDAWEAFGDPADPTPSVWDSGVGVGTFTYADWIWSTFRVNTPTVDETATFERAFTVPGWPASGELKITTDDAYSASFNGAVVGSGSWPYWSTVNSISISPVMGTNTLVVDAVNSAQSWGEAGTIDNNPGGLIYEARVGYYSHVESAWGAGTAFSGKNWATYFTYTLDFDKSITTGLYDVTADHGAWNCVTGVTDLSMPTDSTVTWQKLVNGDVRVVINLDGAKATSTFDVWVEQNPGTCPPGTGTPSNMGAVTTDANGDGTATITFTPMTGSVNFWLTLWTPAGPPYPGTGEQVLRAKAVAF